MQSDRVYGDCTDCTDFDEFLSRGLRESLLARLQCTDPESADYGELCESPVIMS